MLDFLRSEEINPLPSPVEKQHTAAYINEIFKHRNADVKNRLIAEGKLRVINKQERKEFINVVPTNQALEDWKDQSVQFGLHLKQLKEQQQRISKPDNLQIATDMSVSKDKQISHAKRHLNQSELSHHISDKQRLQGLPKLQYLQNLVPQIKRNSDQIEQQPQTFPQQSQIQSKQAIEPQKSCQQPKKQNYKRTQSNDNIVVQKQDQTAQQILARQDSRLRRRNPNSKPWNPNSSDNPNYALNFIKQNDMRTDSFSQDRIMLDSKQWFTGDNQFNFEKDSHIDDTNDNSLLYLVPQAIKRLLSKVSQQYREQRLHQLQQQSKVDNQTYEDRNAAPYYQFDLRQLFQTEMAKMGGGLQKISLSDKKWDEIIKVQDDWHKVEQLAEKALKLAYSGLNPKFLINTESIKKRLAGPKSNASQRVKYVESIGTSFRISSLKEDMGILAYMRRNGLESQSCKGNQKLIIQEFLSETTCHPCLVPKEVITENTISPSILSPKQVTRDSQQSRLSHSTLMSQSEQSKIEISKNQVQDLQESSNDQAAQMIVVQNPMSIRKQSTNMCLSPKMKFTNSIFKQGLSQKLISERTQSQSQNAIPESQKNTYLSSDFWFHKGVVLNQKNQNESAVQCYNQALKIDEKHLPSIFNLACNLEKLQRYEEAKHWFLHAIKVQSQWIDALYGLTLVCIRLEQPDDAIKYIQQAYSIQGDNSAPHIKYAVALAYRSKEDWDSANAAYIPIMKNKTTILTYKEIINKRNQELLESNLNGDLGVGQVEVDLYSHFNDQNLVSQQQYFVDLFPYFDVHEGWIRDKLSHVVSLLKKIRFFNRFDDDALIMMLTKVTLKRIQKNQVLFLREAEAAVLLSGQLHLVSHESDLINPCIVASYNPGDVIGIDNDNGWYGGQHSWLCAWDDVDVFLISDAYIKYMWDNMKQFHQNLVADLLDKVPGFSELSEQTLFTIAHDIAQFREFNDGETIVPQDKESIYNLKFLLEERKAVTNLVVATPEEQAMNQKLKSDNWPTISEIQYRQVTLQEYTKHILELEKEKRRVAKYNLANDVYENSEIQPMQVNSEIVKIVQADKQKVQAINSRLQEQCVRASSVIANSIQKLQQYKKDKEELKAESDGIYIIISGEARVINRYDDQKLVKLCPGDYFGGSRFLKEQRYSYFGDVVACTSASKAIEKKITGTNKAQSKLCDQSTTQCIFLPKELLYLIPYYDLLRLRELNLTDKKVLSLKNKCIKDYREVIRKWKKSFK